MSRATPGRAARPRSYRLFFLPGCAAAAGLPAYADVWAPTDTALDDWPVSRFGSARPLAEVIAEMRAEYGEDLRRIDTLDSDGWAIAWEL